MPILRGVRERNGVSYRIHELFINWQYCTHKKLMCKSLWKSDSGSDVFVLKQRVTLVFG